MSKKSQLDRAIDALDQRKRDILDKASAEVAALDIAILTMKAQRATKRSKGPKAVPDKGEKVG